MTSLPPLPLIDGCLFVDNSGWIENLSTCPRKLEYSQLHRRILGADQPALNFGSAIHLALEYRYVTYKNQPVDEPYYEVVSEMFRDFFSQHPTPESDWRDLNWAMKVIRRYNERYTIEEFNLLKYDQPVKCQFCDGDGSVAGVHPETLQQMLRPCPWCSGTGHRELMVEMPFVLPLFDWTGWFDSHAMIDIHAKVNILDTDEDGDYKVSIPVFYTGRIDLPVSVSSNTFILDHKTTGMMGQTFFDKMRMSAQQRGYCWAFEQLTGKKVSGYVANAIRTKEPPQYVTGDPMAGKPKKYANPETWWTESFQRETYYLKSTDLDEWKRNTIAQIEEFFWHYQRGYLPMRTMWCNQFGRCPYFDVCSLEVPDRGLMLHSGLYTNNDWSPLHEAKNFGDNATSKQTNEQTK